MLMMSLGSVALFMAVAFTALLANTVDLKRMPVSQVAVFAADLVLNLSDFG